MQDELGTERAQVRLRAGSEGGRHVAGNRGDGKPDAPSTPGVWPPAVRPRRYGMSEPVYVYRHVKTGELKLSDEGLPILRRLPADGVRPVIVPRGYELKRLEGAWWE